jgi:dipeptidyl aminopeptidase/acylaminoacyl peptidase
VKTVARVCLPALFLLFAPAAGLAAAPPLSLEDVFSLEYAEDPRISPDGERVAYVRRTMDRMTDRVRGALWTVDADGGRHRPLASGFEMVSHPRWSPDGTRLAWVATKDGETRIWMRWMDSGESAAISDPGGRPMSLAWAPDGSALAFTMHVKEERELPVRLPKKPDGAEWAPAFKVIDTFNYRADGRGYLEPGYNHVFVVPSEGGSPRQLTEGPYHHQGEPAWLPGAEQLVISANRREDADLEPLDSDLWLVSVADGKIRRLTTRFGPDHNPAVSPDGRRIAFTGFDDKLFGYHNDRLYVLELDNGEVTEVTGGLDAGVRAPAWGNRGRSLYFLYDREGQTHLGRVEPGRDEVTTLAGDVGGTTIGRPYASGSFTVTGRGAFAYTMTATDFPAEVAFGDGRGVQRLTRLNDDLLPYRELGKVEDFWTRSSFDQRSIQSWLVLPPGFDPEKKWPLILEIHGGPYANYGPRFSAEMQLYAAAGYVVLYVNPRGSSSYGQAFADLIEDNYPGEDYDDLMSAVDAVVARGYVDPDRLYVTGGSGGGVLTAWIVGKTDRFRAAVSVKPVINWSSFVLTADMYNFFSRNWFPAKPWEQPEEYWRRSPLSLVGNVKTPTMLMTGEDDHRTPISESEQFYQALRLRGVDTMLVRVPGAPHHIAARPTHLMGKVATILDWFGRYTPESGSNPGEAP